MEEVRSGHIEEPLQPHSAPARAASRSSMQRIEELGDRHPTAALAWVAPDGFPLAARAGVRWQGGERRVAITDADAGLPLEPGRACLTAHAHHPDFNWQENFQVRGDLLEAGEGWALSPAKADRRLRASQGERAGPLPAQPGQVGALLQDPQEGAEGARGASRSLSRATRAGRARARRTRGRAGRRGCPPPPSPPAAGGTAARHWPAPPSAPPRSAPAASRGTRAGGR